MNKWIIVGGGIQGITLATFLLKTAKTTIDKLAIIDRYDEPMSNWKNNTKFISMPFLRSPFVHHIDLDPFSLNAFVKKELYNHRTAFFGRYKRPSLDIFNEHCKYIINDLSIEQAWIKGDVCKVSKTKMGWQLRLENGQMVEGEKLALAIGIGEQLNIPHWAENLMNHKKGNIFHVFDKEAPDLHNLKQPVTIIGGGITAAHLAIKLCDLYPKQVTLVKRHSFKIHDFDSDSGWLGPKKQQGFQQISSYQNRRKEIIAARNKGSIPQDIYIKLKNLVKRGVLSVENKEVFQGVIDNENLSLFDKENNLITQTGSVILATGYMPNLPGSNWIKPLIEDLKLPYSKCGYPILSANLQWNQDLYVTGALAELEIGPIARNISGARQAAERIVRNL